MDNQSVAGILGGHEVLKQEKLRPNCRRITDYIQKLLEHGRTLPHWASDPVIWLPREFNNKADSICSKVMDNRAPHVYSHKDIRAIMGTKYNIKIATDGGVMGPEDKWHGVGRLCGPNRQHGRRKKTGNHFRRWPV